MKSRTSLVLLVALISMAFLVGMSWYSGKIKGILMDHDTYRPLPGQILGILALKGSVKADGSQDAEDLKKEVITSKDGSFTLSNIPPGEYCVIIKKNITTSSGIMLPNETVDTVKTENRRTITVQSKIWQVIDMGKVWVQMR
jgi:hypothetical protein